MDMWKKRLAHHHHCATLSELESSFSSSLPSLSDVKSSSSSSPSSPCLGKIDLGARKNVVGWPSILDTLFDSHLFLWTHESKHVREFGFLYSRYCITHQVVLKKKTQHQTFGGNSIAFLSVWFVAPVYCRHGFVRLERICKLEQYVMHNCLQVCSDCFRTLISQPLPFFLCFHNNRS